MAKKIKANKKIGKGIINSIPFGITLLVMIVYILSAFMIVGGIMSMVGSAFFGSLFSWIFGYAPAVTRGVMAFIISALVGIAFGIFCIFIGKGLWNGRNWARILVLIFAVLGILGAITSFNVVNLIVSALIIWYLGFNKEAKAYFR